MAWVMEPIDPESHQIREVYANFGLAMYAAQCLERTMGIALATVYMPEKITRAQLKKIRKVQCEDFLGYTFTEPLGNLVRQIRESVELSEELEEMLSEALRKRNWLAHNYFWERAKTFMSAEGKHDMLEELQKLTDFFNNVDSTFMAILEKWMEKRGITKEVVDRIMEESIESEVTKEMFDRIMRESMDKKEEEGTTSS